MNSVNSDLSCGDLIVVSEIIHLWKEKSLQISENIVSTKGILVLEPHSQDLQDRTQAVAKEMAKVVISSLESVLEELVKKAAREGKGCRLSPSDQLGSYSILSWELRNRKPQQNALTLWPFFIII